MTRHESRGYDLAVETLINAAYTDLSRDREKLLWIAAYLKGMKPLAQQHRQSCLAHIAEQIIRRLFALPAIIRRWIVPAIRRVKP